LGQNHIWVLAPWPGTENTIRGKVVGSPSSGRGESCESLFAHGSSVHQKCSNYAPINLLFGLCRSVWIIDPLVICLNPIPELQHTLLPLMYYELGSTFQLLFLPLFSHLDSQLSPSRSLGVRHGSLKPNFKGFMVDNAQANWNIIKIVYGFRDPYGRMVDKECTHLFHWSHSLNKHTK
jgi:hypothetical protein